MVKHRKMETVLLAAVLLAVLSLSSAQNVRAVDPHYISDTAPAAGIGIGEASRAKPRPPQPLRSEESTNSKMSGTVPRPFSPSSASSSHRSDSHISKETDRTISYVEDVLAGRADVLKGIQDEVFEPRDRVPEGKRPVTTSGYSRIGSSSSSSDAAMSDRVGGTRGEEARERVRPHSSRDEEIPGRSNEGTRTPVSGGSREPTRNSGVESGTGYPRDEIRPLPPSRVVPADSGSMRGRQEDMRGSVESGIPSGSDRPRFSDPPREDLPGSRHGSSHDSFSGSSREDDRGSSGHTRGSPGGNSPSTSNTRGYSQEEDEPKYSRIGDPLAAGVAPKDSYSGNVRKDSRDPNSHGSRDPVVTPSRNTGLGPDRDTVVDHHRSSVSQGTSSHDLREQVFDNNHGASSGNSRDTVNDRTVSGAYDNSRRSDSDKLQDELREHLRETVVPPPRGTVADHSRGTTVDRPRDTLMERDRNTGVDRPRETVVDRPRETVVNRPRETLVSRPRDTVMERDRNTGVDRPRETVVDRPRETVVDRPRETMVSRPRDTVMDRDRDTSVDGPRDTAMNHNRETLFDNSRSTVVNHPRDIVVEQSRGTKVEKPHIPMDDYSQPSSVDDSRENVPYKSTTTRYHQEPAMSSSWDNYEPNEHNSERASELAQPMSYPTGGSVEEPAYTSKTTEYLESAFGYDSTEYEDIDGAHSSRPLPKTQKPRQVSAVAERRGPRAPHPPSPCPSVFSYEGTRAGKERWYGVVLITTTETLVGVRLEIALDKRSDLLGTWLGEVSSVDNIRYTIWNGRRKIVPGPPLSVKIFVKYSEEEYEPPRIRSIRLNGRQICPKDQVLPMPAPPRPPSRPNQPTNRPGQQGGRPGVRPNRPGSTGVHNPKPHGNGRPNQKPGTSDQSTAETELVDGVACGRIEVQPSPLITYGQRTSRGQWPWHAAIYQSKGTDLSYICGGSLIGKRTVLTAAHCVSRRYIDRPVDSESLVVYLGKYHLKLWSEGGVQDKQVLEVHVHPDYNSTDFRADIAILILSSQVEFTMYVKPVCLWDRNRAELNEVEGHEGVVVGWGYDERGMITEDLMMAKMPIVSQQTCIWSYPQFFSHFTSERTFCAGFRNGTSVCNGDSGGGMVFPKSTGLSPGGDTVTWALRGIVSLSTSQANKRVCNTEHYVVFTDIVRFYDWVDKYH